MDLIAYAKSKQYTDESLIGGGAVKGKNCTISKIEEVDGGNKVTFSWTLDDGTVKTQTLNVKDGSSIASVEVDADNHIIVTLTDGSKLDGGEMPKPDVEISKEEGNALIAKTDGLYVGATGVEISKEEGNIIQNKTDGLYAKADEITVDPDVNNILENRTDGLYVPKTDLSGYVEVEDGKSLVANEDITQITVNKTAIEVLNGDAETAGSVDKKLADAIATLNKLEKKILDHVPTVEEAKDNVLYLVETETSGTYNQHMLIDGAIANLGSTDIDLDGYAKTEDVVLLQQAIVDKGKSLIVGEDGKVIVGNAQIDIVTEFAETTSDEKVPSEKLVKDSLDNKADSAIVTGHINLDVGSDLNTLVDYGTYRTTTKRIDRISNVPVQVAGMLEVRLTGGIIYHTYKTIDDEMYIRSSEDTGATWADWKKLSTGADGLEVVRLTKAEYDALTEAEKNDPTKLYDVYDEESLNLTDYAKQSEVNALSTELNDRFTDLIKIVAVSFSRSTIPANAMFSVTNDIDIPIGYKAIGIASHNLSRMKDCYYSTITTNSGTQVNVGGYNNSTATEFNGNVNVMCIKV